MAYTKTEGYTTTRETSLETSLSSGSSTSKSTRNEYSVPFNNFSAADHLVKAFTLSGATSDANDPADPPNGVYRKQGTGAWTQDTYGHNFALSINSSGAGSTNQWKFEFQDTDFDPYCTRASFEPTESKQSLVGAQVLANLGAYPWNMVTGGWTDVVGSMSSATYSNPVGSDFE